MKSIEKIKLQNFKRFQEFTVEFDEKINLLIGDNEAGKSSILSAIDVVLSGSRSKIETLGLDGLFNIDVIKNFLKSDKKYEELPKLFIEVYLNEQNNSDLNGKVNSDEVLCDGLRLICEPNDDLSKEIKEILGQSEANFPFEYYSISFKTFAGENYTGYRKFLRHILIDNTQISNEYATRQYVSSMYQSSVENSERNKHQNEYRKYKQHFRDTVLKDMNDRISDYSFSIKTNSKSNLETDLTISENEIEIENKGKGRQCFIKTEFALKKNKIDKNHVPYIRPSNNQKTSLDGYVDKDKINKKYIFPENTLYVSTDGQGSHTFSYVTPFEFIPNSNVVVLIPKSEMTLIEKLYYALCITKNRYKFSYGRKPKGNRLEKLLLPNFPKELLEGDFAKSILQDWEKMIPN